MKAARQIAERPAAARRAFGAAMHSTYSVFTSALVIVFAMNYSDRGSPD